MRQFHIYGLILLLWLMFWVLLVIRLSPVYVDEIHKADDSTLKGKIIEFVPDRSYKIKLADGSEFDVNPKDITRVLWVAKQPKSLADWTQVATILGVGFAVLALVITGLEVDLSRRANQASQKANQASQKANQASQKANEANVWLELRKMFWRFDDVHMKLRSNLNSVDEDWDRELKEWFSKLENAYPREWAEVEAYMGLFEHCKLMLDNGLLNWPTFMRIYAYRIGNILSNRTIVTAKLVDEADGWVDFIELIGEVAKIDSFYQNQVIPVLADILKTTDDDRKEARDSATKALKEIDTPEALAAF